MCINFVYHEISKPMGVRFAYNKGKVELKVGNKCKYSLLELHVESTFKHCKTVLPTIFFGGGTSFSFPFYCHHFVIPFRMHTKATTCTTNHTPYKTWAYLEIHTGHRPNLESIYTAFLMPTYKSVLTAGDIKY